MNNIYFNTYFDIEDGGEITKEEYKTKYKKAQKPSKHYKKIKDDGRTIYITRCETRYYGIRDKQGNLFP